MMGKRIKQLLPLFAGALSLILLCGVLWFFNSRYTQWQRRIAENVTQLYGEVIARDLETNFNYTDRLKTAVLSGSEEELKRAEAEAAAKEAVIEAHCYRDGELDLYQNGLMKKDGREWESYESYQYRLALLRKELIIYGPVWSERYGKDIMITILPVYRDEDSGKEDFWGFASVVMDAKTVMENLGLERIEMMGYDYELWFVSAETGHKNVVQVSDKEKNFTGAVEASFYMPAKWTLSMVPTAGWGITWLPAAALLSLLVSIGAVIAVQTRVWWHDQRIRREQEECLDPETGLYNRKGLDRYLDRHYKGKEQDAVFFAVEIPEFHKVYCLMEKAQQAQWLDLIAQTISRYTKNRTVAARLYEATYVLVFEGRLGKEQVSQLTKEIEIDLIQCVYVKDVKYSMIPYVESLAFPQEAADIAQAPQILLRRLWNQR